MPPDSLVVGAQVFGSVCAISATAGMTWRFARLWGIVIDASGVVICLASSTCIGYTPVARDDTGMTMCIVGVDRVVRCAVAIVVAVFV